MWLGRGAYMSRETKLAFVDHNSFLLNNFVWSKEQKEKNRRIYIFNNYGYKNIYEIKAVITHKKL